MFRILALAAYQATYAESIELAINLNGNIVNIPVAVDAAPLSTAAELCRSYDLSPASSEKDRCETLLSGEIHRLQTIEMSQGSTLIPPESQLASYYRRAKDLESQLASTGFRVNEGHSGLVTGKTEYLSRLARAPLIKRIVEIGMVSGFRCLSALFFHISVNTKIRTPGIPR